MNELVRKFKDKEILILGLGREGVSTYNFLRKLDDNLPIHFADRREFADLNTEFHKIAKKDKNTKFKCGKNYLDSLSDYDLIIKTPGIPRKIKEVKDAIEKGVFFTSQTQIFLERYREKTIGVTGTKGKSTTTSLIYHVLKSSGTRCEVLGNIGKPVLDYYDVANDLDCVVFEMSSHQLFDITVSPHIAVFLNIFHEHLDYYENFDEYFAAKANITKYQHEGDVLVYNGLFEKIDSIAKKSKATAIDYSKVNVSRIETKLLGRHNRENIKAVIAVSRELGISEDTTIEGIRTFQPLEGRLELVGTFKGVSFVNDTLATIPEATVEAIDSYGNKKITLILGGFDRGVSFSGLASEIKKRINVSAIVLVGQTASRIKNELEKNGYLGKIIELGFSKMTDILGTSFELSEPGSVVLLSPASTSFDMFKDYKDRGNQFKSAFKKLKDDRRKSW